MAADSGTESCNVRKAVRCYMVRRFLLVDYVEQFLERAFVGRVLYLLVLTVVPAILVLKTPIWELADRWFRSADPVAQVVILLLLVAGLFAAFLGMVLQFGKVETLKDECAALNSRILELEETVKAKNSGDRQQGPGNPRGGAATRHARCGRRDDLAETRERA